MRHPGLVRNAQSSAAVPPVDRSVRGLTLAQFTEGTPWRTALQHDRQLDVLIWITRGQGVVTINGFRRGIGAHNALFLPKNTLFSLEFGAQTLAQVVVSQPGLNVDLPNVPTHLRIRDSFAQAEMTGAIEALQREQSQSRQMIDAALAAHLGLISVWLNRQVAEGASDDPPDTAARRLAQRFSQALVEDFRLTRTMAYFAELLNVTPTHLTRVCKTCCGKTAAEILTERRIYAARVALSSSEKTIKAISEDLGFNSPAYFTRFVLQHTGQTPTALRAQTAEPKK